MLALLLCCLFALQQLRCEAAEHQSSPGGAVTKITIQRTQPKNASRASKASNDGDSVHLLNYLDAQVNGGLHAGLHGECFCCVRWRVF